MKSEGSDLGYGGFEGQQAEGAQEEGLLHLQRRVIGKTRTGWVLFLYMPWSGVWILLLIGRTSLLRIGVGRTQP
jgi:hypothetical protein